MHAEDGILGKDYRVPAFRGPVMPHPDLLARIHPAQW